MSIIYVSEQSLNGAANRHLYLVTGEDMTTALAANNLVLYVFSGFSSKNSVTPTIIIGVVFLYTMGCFVCSKICKSERLGAYLLASAVLANLVLVPVALDALSDGTASGSQSPFFIIFIFLFTGYNFFVLLLMSLLHIASTIIVAVLSGTFVSILSTKTIEMLCGLGYGMTIYHVIYVLGFWILKYRRRPEQCLEGIPCVAALETRLIPMLPKTLGPNWIDNALILQRNETIGSSVIGFDTAGVREVENQWDEYVRSHLGENHPLVLHRAMLRHRSGSGRRSCRKPAKADCGDASDRFTIRPSMSKSSPTSKAISKPKAEESSESNSPDEEDETASAVKDIVVHVDVDKPILVESLTQSERPSISQNHSKGLNFLDGCREMDIGQEIHQFSDEENNEHMYVEKTVSNDGMREGDSAEGTLSNDDYPSDYDRQFSASQDPFSRPTRRRKKRLRQTPRSLPGRIAYFHDKLANQNSINISDPSSFTSWTSTVVARPCRKAFIDDPQHGMAVKRHLSITPVSNGDPMSRITLDENGGAGPCRCCTRVYAAVTTYAVSKRLIVKKACWKRDVQLPGRAYGLLFVNRKIEKWYIQWLQSFTVRYYKYLTWPLAVICTLFLIHCSLPYIVVFGLLKGKALWLIIWASLRFGIHVVLDAVFLFLLWRRTTVAGNGQRTIIVALGLTITQYFFAIVDLVFVLFSQQRLTAESFLRVSAWTPLVTSVILAGFLLATRMPIHLLLQCVAYFCSQVVHWSFGGAIGDAFKFTVIYSVVCFVSLFIVIRAYELNRRCLFAKAVLPYLVYLDELYASLDPQTQIIGKRPSNPQTSTSLQMSPKPTYM